jgi:hypothetical protein
MVALAIVRNERDIDGFFTRTFGPNEHSRARQILKAASSPTDTTSGASFLATARQMLLTGLAPKSAFAKILARALQIDFDGTYQVAVPRINSSTAPVFVAESNPVIVIQDTFASSTLGPVSKLSFSAIFTAELEKYAVRSAANILQVGLLEKSATALDTVGFDNVAATLGTRPAGLLNGLSTLGATAGGGLAALAGDIGKIATAMTTAGISTENLVLVMNQADAARARILAPFGLPEIIGTLGLAAGTIVGVVPDGIATGFLGNSEVSLATDTAVVMQDSNPPQISTSPGPVLGAPVLSLWQMNLIGIKIRTECCWGIIQPGAVQFISSVTW